MISAIILDSREPQWIKDLAPTFDVPCLVQLLPCGDAWVQCDDGALVIVERKALPDLVSSITDGRLFNQAREMIEMSPWSYVAIFGHPLIQGGHVWYRKGHATGMKWKALQGALLTLQDIGVGVVWREADMLLFKDTLLWLAKRDRGEVKPAPRRATGIVSKGEEVLMSLDGISIKLAQAAVVACGSAGRALEQLTSLIAPSTIPGVGIGKRRQVRASLGLDPGEQMYVIGGPERAVVEIKDGGGRLLILGDYALQVAERLPEILEILREMEDT